MFRHFWHTMIENILSERERWALWLPFSFGLGIGFYFALPFEPPILISIISCGFIALLIYQAHHFNRLWLWHVILIMTGFCLIHFNAIFSTSPVLTQTIKDVKISGKIIESELSGTGKRIILDHVRIQGIYNKPEKIRIVAKNSSELLKAGNWVGVYATLIS